MKKILSYILAMIISLALCPSLTACAEETAPMPGGMGEALPFGTGYVGQVSEIEGYIVTVTLGSFEGAANMPEGERPERPEGDTQMPKGGDQPPMGDMQMPQGEGQPPMGDMQMPQGEGQPPMGDMQMPQGGGQPPMGDMQMSGGYQQMSDTSMQQPDGEGRMHGGGMGRGGFGAGAEGAERDMGFGGVDFVPDGETMSFDLENVLISRQGENGTEDCAFEDIALGDILVIETDEDDVPLSVLIIGPMEAGENPPEKPEDAI